MNLTSFNGAALNGVVNAWVLAVAGIVAGGSVDASGLQVQSGAAAVDGGAAASATFSFRTGGVANADAGVGIVVQPSLRQSAASSAQASASATANVAGTVYGTATATAGATVLALPASKLGTAGVVAGASLVPTAVKIQLAGAGAVTSAQVTMGASLVTRRASASLCGSAQAFAGPRINNGVHEVYAFPLSTASITVNELVLMTNAAFAAGAADATAYATKQQSGIAEAAGKTAIVVADPGTVTYVSNPMAAGALAAASADRVAAASAEAGPCTAGLALLQPRQQHFGVSAPQGGAVATSSPFVRAAGSASADGACVAAATAVRRALPTADIDPDSDVFANATCTAKASAALGGSAVVSAAVDPVAASAALSPSVGMTAASSVLLDGSAGGMTTSNMVASATGLIRITNTGMPYSFLVDGSSFNGAPFGWAPFGWTVQRTVPLIAGTVDIFVDSVSNGAAIDPDDRTFYRPSQNTAFTRPAQTTTFWRPA